MDPAPPLLWGPCSRDAAPSDWRGPRGARLSAPEPWDDAPSGWVTCAARESPTDEPRGAEAGSTLHTSEPTGTVGLAAGAADAGGAQMGGLGGGAGCVCVSPRPTVALLRAKGMRLCSDEQLQSVTFPSLVSSAQTEETHTL